MIIMHHNCISIVYNISNYDRKLQVFYSCDHDIYILDMCSYLY